MSQKTAVITGVSSFVGCHIAHTFAQAGWRVVALTSRDVSAYDGIRSVRLDYIRNDVDFQVCDLTDGQAVQALVRNEQPDLWVQHAGFADNYASLDYDFTKSLKLNVEALVPLYEALAGTGCSVIMTGSSLEYTRTDKANAEDDVCWPDMPYGASKLMGTVLAGQLAQRHNVPTRVARLFLPFGPLDVPGKLMSSVIEKLKAQEQMSLTPCTQRKDFLSVEDICNGYLKLSADMDRTVFDVFNISSGEAVELKTFLQTLADTIGAERSLLQFGAIDMRPGEPDVLYGDNQKARRILNWSPTPLEAALKSLIAQVK